MKFEDVEVTIDGKRVIAKATVEFVTTTTHLAITPDGTYVVYYHGFANLPFIVFDNWNAEEDNRAPVTWGLA